MALSCLGTGGNRERLELVNVGGALDLPATGWTVTAMFYPDSGIGVNTFGYIYSHGDPQVSAPALNILVTQATSRVRCIVTSIFGTEADFESSNAIIPDQWNHVGVRYDEPTRVAWIHLNGVSTSQATAFALNTLTPTGNAYVGCASFGTGGREFNGRICHNSKWDRAFSEADVNYFTGFLLSPEFAQTDHIWHTPIWNSSFNGDQLNTITTTPVGALYGNHASAKYPDQVSYVLPVKRTPPPTTLRQRVQWSLA